jgi:hypothetical protein
VPANHLKVPADQIKVPADQIKVRADHLKVPADRLKVILNVIPMHVKEDWPPKRRPGNRHRR